MNDTLGQLLSVLDAKQAQITEWDKYYEGKQPLAYLSPEAKTALGSRFGRMASNIPRLAVASLAERLRVTGFTGDEAEQVWAAWLRCDLDQLSAVAHREALALGRSHAIVWADRRGKARVTIESARQVAVYIDPGSRDTLAAVKRWETLTPAGVPDRTFAVLYEPDRITRYVGKSTSATAFEVAEVIDNPLGVVPVVSLRNSDRILDEGCSEIEDLKPLVDGLNKTLADLLVGSEYYARPRRWATGLELEEIPVLDDEGNETGETESVNPIPDSSRVMINEDPAGKFGSLPAADLAAYEAAVRVLTSQIGAVSALPAHYLGVLTNQPASADALRAAEASLTARAEAKMAMFGRAHEEIGRLILAVENQRDPDEYQVRVRWADPATRSVAQEADAKVKLHAEGILTTEEVRADLGIDTTTTIERTA
ncbi:phage portal protein [Mycobacteroides abscessus]|nr:phage portal protein [Mycobacteroides abscessus]RIT84234.1 phage portal protein [Mycobacteroides abscessus]